MTWYQAMTWVSSLNVSGITGWRLPEAVDVGSDGGTFTNIYQGVDYGFNISSHSELSNIFYNVLGNTAYWDVNGVTTGCSAPNYCLTNAGPFSIQPDVYWSSTVFASEPHKAWDFSMALGGQGNGSMIGADYYAWAVLDGDIGAVPIPSAVWLFGSGLLGLVGVARRKKA